MARAPALLLTLAVALSLCAGCAGGDGVTSGSPPSSTAAATTIAPASTTSSEAATTSAAAVATTTTQATTTTAPAGTWASPSPGCPADDGGRCAAASAAGTAFLTDEVTGGTSGFFVVRIGGETVASANPRHRFYPASSIKVLHHLHAVRWVGSQPDVAAALDTRIRVYDDTCAGAGSSHDESLGDVLTAMMIDSDNVRTNAVQDHFGRAALNETARGIGLVDTALEHRFACGGPANDPANRSTAYDLTMIYEGVGGGRLLGAEEADLFRSMMLSAPWAGLVAVVAVEAGGSGLPAETAGRFLDAIRMVYKAGWWDTDLSIGALLELPSSPCADADPRSFAAAAFVDGAAAVSSTFHVEDVISTVLQADIGEALARFAEIDPSTCPPAETG